jgi:hypothetical protein
MAPAKTQIRRNVNIKKPTEFDRLCSIFKLVAVAPTTRSKAKADR